MRVPAQKQPVRNIEQLGTRNWIFGYPESVKKMGLKQVEQGFSSFFAKSQWARKFKKVEEKKFVKSNKSFSKMAKNQFLNWETF